MTDGPASVDGELMARDQAHGPEQLSRRSLLGRSMAVGGTLAVGSLYGGAATSALAQTRSGSGWGPPLPTSGNPAATAEQRDLEALAIQLLSAGPVVQAKQAVANRWRTIVGPANITAEAQARFNELVDEFTFHYVLLACASDPSYPHVLGSLFSPPHQWFGMSVPGSRSGGAENPDNYYAVIPVQYGTAYEIRGRRFQPTPADKPLSVSGNPSLTMTLGTIDMNQLDLDLGGSFRITVSPDPANGDPNHVQTFPEAMYLFLRYSRSDWRQVPDALQVRRTDGPTAEQWTEDQIAARAAAILPEDVPAMFWFNSIFAALPPNFTSPPANTGGVGGLPTQSTSFARLQLADDEAFIVTVGPGGAAYRSLVLYDFWLRSIEYWQRLTSFNNAQSAPNPDGKLTYVVSKQDPGVANWLDTTGLQQPRIIQRWQRVNPSGPDGPPSITGKLVKLADLAANLPAGVPTVTPSERQQQLDRRAAEFAPRFQT